VAADGQQPGVRRLAVQAGRDAQDRPWRERVAQGRQPGGRADAGERKGPAQAAGGVDEDDEVMRRAGQGVLDIELVVGVANDALEPALRQPLDEGGPQAVVAAARITDPQDERRGPFR
jgi:hypothetical protein